ncbi:hypothetical protein GCM10011328_40670 [Hafnia psychrotolerans]|uniref:Uncharacterized protein n=1 Tax=Hafnia psychrotolerans TaxID=1477018 RepID=A0ABQ1H6N2_9GAMM|nr:hypothetical protein GCM10011328_40670 [Hafnia psychrotolerans]
MLKFSRQSIEFFHSFIESFFVIGFNRQFQQTGYIITALGQLVDGFDNRFQRGTFFTQRLCTFRFVPDIRLFELGVYFFEAFFLGIIVKDTP